MIDGAPRPSYREAVRRAAALALIALAATAGTAAGRPSGPSGEPRLLAASLVYVGAFRLPAAVDDKRTFDHGGTALAYDPGRNGLFVVGHDWYQLDAEVSIPPLRRSRSVSGLRRARFLQPFRDATGGKLDTTGGDTNKLGGQLVLNGRLFGTVYSRPTGRASCAPPGSRGAACREPASPRRASREREGSRGVSQQLADGPAPVIDVFRLR